MLVIQNILWLLVLIGVMILIHELGHFWAARYLRRQSGSIQLRLRSAAVRVPRGETDYRFSAILFGGYVKMAASSRATKAPTIRDGLLAKPRWQRLIIAFAGPFMNMVLAVALLTGLYMVKYQKMAEPDQRAVIGHVSQDPPPRRPVCRRATESSRSMAKESHLGRYRPEGGRQRLSPDCTSPWSARESSLRRT